MIINNAPAQEAVLSNVGEIGEFRIRNSAKAFNILSSGLYANKIRAIVRELSCNAVDSHTAAGRQDTPFDVHLPTQLEPTFSIRDYGTGLTHEQVVNIYTTYFESTKTESNQFIGALGLGSKSPFSYTDNFTVTAIRDGVRGVYSAFINGEGVPSIALMHSEPTDQPNGVEVQFAVTDRWDFDKFQEEARYVYTYFALRPVVSGGHDFEFRNIEYKDRNIVPGVHYTDSRTSRAVMGNIAYPIDIPNADSNLGSLAKLLNCGLEMHFDIGELDFQASREGLSYIPQTVNAIKAKLEALNAQLTVHLALEADAISNLWERAVFLMQKNSETLWASAVVEYVRTTQFPLIEDNNGYLRRVEFKHDVKDLAAMHNIQILAFSKSRGQMACQQLKPNKEYKNNGYTDWDEVWHLPAEDASFFVVNDTKTGALSRAKHHWRQCKELPATRSYQHNVFVLQPAVKNKLMDTVGFLAKLMNPPRVLKASELIQKERKEAGARGQDVRILKMEVKNYGRGRDTAAWGEAGRADQYDTNSTYYYIPLSGYASVNGIDVKELWDNMRRCGINQIAETTVYGVRKTDIEFIKTQKNWVDLEQHLGVVLNNLAPETLMNMAISEFDNSKVFSYNRDIANKVENQNSPYLALTTKFKGKTRIHYNSTSLTRLLNKYAPTVNLQSIVDVLKAEIASVRDRYSLLKYMSDYNINEASVAEYINLIDNSKGV